jgi:hypothetical protein
LPTAEDSVLYKPWRSLGDDQPHTQTKLRVGILRHDGVARPVREIEVALEYAKSKLIAAHDDFEVVDYTPILGEEVWDVTVRLHAPIH